VIRAPTTHERPTRREREVNWGDKTKIRGNEKKTLAWVSVSESQPMVVYATAVVRGGAAAVGVACVVNLEWGHGGASVDQDFPVVHRLRVPLAASMVKASGRLLDANGQAPAATVSCEVSLLIAPGLDGQTLRNTTWVHDAGAEGTLSEGPARIMRVEGYNGGAVDTWIMLCDGPGANGDVPTIARRVAVGRRFTVVRFDSHSFRTSITWFASSTPLTLTKDPTARVRVDAELLL
jgi:hypothetical protein